MNTILFATLIVHGLITTAIALGSFRPGEPIPNPSWLGWWPINLGESWLVSDLRLPDTLFSPLFALGWLAGGLLLIASGLALFDILLPQELWRQLAILGSAISLVMLVLYLHPLYVLGITLSAGILIALLTV